MQRTLSVIIAFHWAALFCLTGIVVVTTPGSPAGSSFDMVVVGAQAFAQFAAAAAFFYVLSTLLAQRGNEAEDRRDAGRIAIGAGLIATTVGMLAATALGHLDHILLSVVVFAALLVSHMVLQSERPALRRKLAGANDNSRTTARLLAMLAATDARTNRIVAASRPGGLDHRP